MILDTCFHLKRILIESLAYSNVSNEVGIVSCPFSYSEKTITEKLTPVLVVELYRFLETHLTRIQPHSTH